MLCERSLEAQAVASEACVPFWRRLQESFRYPLNSHSMTLVVGFALISAILNSSAMIFILAIGLNLLMLSAMMKYCFSCLERTSLGDMRAPDITEAYGGGFKTIIDLFIMTMFFGFVIGIVARVFGEALAGLTAMILMMGFPAMLINYALSGSLISALNLASMFRLIGTIGLPYGLLIAFISIMFASIELIHSLIGNYLAFVSSFLQYIVTWYYIIVTFHLMGYMIYQYQDRLGYVAHSNEEVDDLVQRSEEQGLLLKINVLLKEGELDRVVSLFEQGVAKFPSSESLLQRYFDFLVRTRSKNNLEEFADKYLLHQVKCSRFDRLSAAYKQIIALVPEYSPQRAELRYYIGRACLHAGDPASALKLLRGLHRSDPDFEHLIEAYEVMLEALQSLSGMEGQAAKCKSLLAHLRAQRPQKPVQAAAPRKVMFAASELSSSQASDTIAAKREEETKVEVNAEEDKPKDLPPIEFKP